MNYRLHLVFLICGIVIFCSSACVAPSNPLSGDGPNEEISEEAPIAMGETKLPGTISGRIVYPAENLPQMRVVAFNADNPEVYFYTEVYAGDQYQLEADPGVYFVLAYLIGTDAHDESGAPAVGAYTIEVHCSIFQDCGGQNLLGVAVSPGQYVNGIDIMTWFAVDQLGEDWPSDPIQ